MAGRTTSAAYRLPTASSSYHEKCIAPSVRALQEASSRAMASGEKAHPQHAYRNCDVVTHERIWKEHCQKERKHARNWQTHWGFYTEYDYKGNSRPKKELPAKLSFYATSAPHTTSQQFGASVGSRNCNEIRRLEMLICHKKKKSDLKGEQL